MQDLLKKALTSFLIENYSPGYLMPKVTPTLILFTSISNVIAFILLHTGESINLCLGFKMEFRIGQFVCSRNEKNFFSLLVTPVGPIAIKMLNCSRMQRNIDSASLEIT